MKITLISLITLSVGLFVGHFWGVGTEQARTRAQLTDTKSSSDRPLGGAEEEETRTARTEDEGNAQGGFASMLAEINEMKTLSDAGFAQKLKEVEKYEAFERAVKRYLLYAAWADSNPASALAFIDENVAMDRQIRYFARRTVFAEWAKADPVAAAQGLSAYDAETSGRGLSRNIEAIAVVWAAKDSEAAFTWLKSLDNEAKGSAVSSYFRTLAEQDADQALAKAYELSSDQFNIAISSVARQWGNAATWAEVEAQIQTLPQTAQEAAKLSAVRTFAQEQPYEATEIISELPNDSDTKYRLVRTVLERIGEENPAGALDWALSNTDGREQSRVAYQVFQPWMQNDSDAAGKWLLTQPNDEVTRRMVSYMQRSENVSEAIKNQLSSAFPSDEEE